MSKKNIKQLTLRSSETDQYSEYKGFFIYILSTIFLYIWIGWTLLPEKFINNFLSIYYYPDKYWSVAIPSYSLMLMLFIYILLAMYNTKVKTLPLDDIRNFVDNYSFFAGLNKLDNSNYNLSDEDLENAISYTNKPSSGVKELSISLVNEFLYSKQSILSLNI